MCGIAGFISKKNIEHQVIEQMRDSMIRRGPDGGGIYRDQRFGRDIALAHRRLSILDLSERGTQPMLSPDQNVVITFNGEIYNYQKVKKELQELGHTFNSDCDTEVILNAYMQWGIQSVEKLSGMFAYAIYDRNVGKLFLVRDRMGEKPLYYSIIPENGIIFGSELAALRDFPYFQKEIDISILRLFLWNMYIPAPYSIFKNTFKLESGHILEFSIETERVKNYAYWSLDDIYEKNVIKSQDKSETIVIEELEELLTTTVKSRMISDVPLGIFLSSGIDSSLIAALAQNASNRTIDTFSIGFEETGRDEAVYAKKIARHLGTNHHEKYCTLKEALEYIKKIPEAYSEPFADNSQIPMMMLSEFTREYVTVALSGDGGDELFYGYPWDKQLLRYDKMRFIAKLLKVVPRVNNLYSPQNWKLSKLKAMSKQENLFCLDYVASQTMIDSMFRKEILLQSKILNPWKDKLSTIGTLEERSLNLQQKISLQDDMIVKVDRATMAYSLEARAPFLNHDVVEYAATIPINMKCKDGQFKYPLKQILYKYVPRELMERPKMGFGVPINEWLHKDLKEMIGDYVSRSYVDSQGIFEISEIERMYRIFENGGNPALDRIMWCYLMFQMWWENCCKSA